MVKITRADKDLMRFDLNETGMAKLSLYSINRRKQTVDTVLGGVSITSTAIGTILIEIQELNSQERLSLGGLRVEGEFRGFTPALSNILEGDIITGDSGSNKYEVIDVSNLYDDHQEFIAKKVE